MSDESAPPGDEENVRRPSPVMRRIEPYEQFAGRRTEAEQREMEAEAREEIIRGYDEDGHPRTGRRRNAEFVDTNINRTAGARATTMAAQGMWMVHRDMRRRQDEFFLEIGGHPRFSERMGLTERKRQVVKPVVMEVELVDEGVAINEPTFCFDYEMSSQLLGAMWQAGIRPENWEEPEIKVVDADVLLRMDQERRDQAKRFIRDNSRLSKDLAAMEQRALDAERRLDRALELLGMERPPRRVTVRGNNGSREEEETP